MANNCRKRIYSLLRFEDSRIKRYRPSAHKYPYTIEYEYEIRVKQSLVLPEWYPVSRAGVALVSSVFKVLAKPDFPIRYKELNLADGVKKETTPEGFLSYSWTVSNLKALRPEPYSPPIDRYLPSVKIAPVSFSYQNVKGSYNNWEEYGKWTNEKLLAGRDVLPDATKKYIQELTAGIDDPKLKAKKIYEFLQNKTRYISIQIGIGGFQPYPAMDVDRLSYGDCKGLVNYMKALLNVVGIKSWYTVVEAGSMKQDALPDFASINQFNHVILCIPFPNDTTWLDCTSKTLPFGYLGDFTDDRLALACTEEGGKLIRTPKLKTEKNLQFRTTSFDLDPSGNITAQVKTTFEGAQYDNRNALIDEPYTEQLKGLKEIYGMSMSIGSFKLEQDKGLNPITTEHLSFKHDGYGTMSGDRMVIPINLLEPFRRVPREVANRINPCYLNRGYTDHDEVTFTLPETFRLDSKPQDIIIEKPFGKFHFQLSVEGRTLKYKRFLQLKDGLYDPAMYDEFVGFLQKVADADADRVTIVKF